MKISLIAVRVILAALLVAAAPARADEIFAGLYAHDVDTFLTKSGFEQGVDVQLGWRGEALVPGTRLQPYVFAALNSSGDTNYAAAGLSLKFGDRLFVRPGLGIAVHSGSTDEFERRDRIAFGSRILFEPELGIGARIGERATIEASWVHMSHGQLFGGQNPGIDNIGARLHWKF